MAAAAGSSSAAAGPSVQPDYPRDMFVDEEMVLKMYGCSICAEVFKDPTVVPCFQGHVFCKGCIEKWISESSKRGGDPTCPTCKGEINQVECRPDYHSRRIVLNMLTYCGNKGDGCDWRGALSEWHSHAATCPRARKACSGEGCAERLLLADIAAHEKACTQVLVSCKNKDIGCAAKVKRGSLAAHLNSGCRARCAGHMMRWKRKADQFDSLRKRARLHIVEPAADGEFVSFRVRVKNWNQGEKWGQTALRDNSVSGLHWKLELSCITAIVEGVPTKYLAVYLRTTYQSNRHIQGRYAVSLVNADAAKSVTKDRRTGNGGLYELGAGSSNATTGWPRFAPLAEVNDPEKGFLHGGDLVFQVTLSNLAVNHARPAESSSDESSEDDD